jgi:hypothetical protein
VALATRAGTSYLPPLFAALTYLLLILMFRARTSDLDAQPAEH